LKTSKSCAILQCLGIFGGFLFGSSAFAEDPLHLFLKDLKSLRANFEQIEYDEHQKEIRRSQGTLDLQRPSRFRWEYQKPYVQSIISDGTQVWFYDPDLAQVTIKPYSRALANTPAVLLSSDEPIEKNFLVSKPHDGKIELRPKTKDTGFVKAIVGFSGLELQSMELEDSFGQKTHLQFSAIQRNHEVPEELFSFTPPTGVDVITAEGKK